MLARMSRDVERVLLYLLSPSEFTTHGAQHATEVLAPGSLRPEGSCFLHKAATWRSGWFTGIHCLRPAFATLCGVCVIYLTVQAESVVNVWSA